MPDGPNPVPPDADPQPLTANRRSASARVVALLEVLLCSDYPTQTALGTTFIALGYGPYTASGQLRVGFVVTLSLADTVLLVGLMVFFLLAHGERPRDVFLGHRPAAPEASFGVPLVLVALVLGVAVLATIQRFAPSLHTVEHNPLQDLIRNPRDIWMFAVVVVVAGGVREELQRAFLLHRFEHWLGGTTVGLVVCSLAFGAGHLLQGVDAAVTTGTLGLFWGIVYVRRRSAIAPIVSHSGFNLLQIVQFVVAGR
jgi:membrane protease YdiL (CAAX protease family)